MAGALTRYSQQKLLDHLLGKTAFTSPSTYLGLFTASPGETGGGTEVSTSGTAYARQLINAAGWVAATNASPSVSANSGTITFAVATASWGTIAYWALLDAVSGGNMLIYGSFGTPRAITIGQQAQLLAGGLSVSAD